MMSSCSNPCANLLNPTCSRIWPFGPPIGLSALLNIMNVFPGFTPRSVLKMTRPSFSSCPSGTPSLRMPASYFSVSHSAVASARSASYAALSRRNFSTSSLVLP